MFGTLPLYPGARLESSYSGGLPGDNGNPLHEAGPPYKAFVTTHRYQLPKSATQKAVLSFYHQRLEAEWRWFGPGQGPGPFVVRCAAMTLTTDPPPLGIPHLLQWPVVDDGDALVIEDLACLW